MKNPARKIGLSIEGMGVYPSLCSVDAVSWLFPMTTQRDPLKEGPRTTIICSRAFGMYEVVEVEMPSFKRLKVIGSTCREISLKSTFHIEQGRNSVCSERGISF